MDMHLEVRGRTDTRIGGLLGGGSTQTQSCGAAWRGGLHEID